jgi:hypothetical protein
MSGDIPGIPTEYDGTVFRSRLEARWAAFANLAGWQWVYEPFDGAGYLPDFLFTIGDRALLVEVKPVATAEDAKSYLPKIFTGIADLWKKDVVVCGLNPLRTLYLDFLHSADDWHTSEAVFSNCPHCHNSLNLHPAHYGYGCTKCGYDKWASAPMDGYVDMLWRKAGNDTRWVPAA